MNKWIIVIVSAITDGGIAAGTAIMTAMAGADKVALPSDGVLVTAIIGGIVIGLRTVQQHLKKFTEE